MSEKIITEKDYDKAMKYKEWLEKELERTTKITRAYVYQWEAERVKARKIQATLGSR